MAVEVGVRGGPARRYERDGDDGWRIEFDVRYTATGKPNKGRITLHNVRGLTVSDLRRDNTEVRLLAGHNGTETTVFLGDPVPKESRRIDDPRTPGSTIVITVADGLRLWDRTFLNESFGREVLVADVFNTVADAAGLPLGTVDLGDTRLTQGVVLEGGVRRALDRVADMSGARWWVAAGVLHVVRRGGVTTARAPVLSARTGNLVLSPTPTDEGLECTALLTPGLRPGGAYFLESDEYVGEYIAEEVRHWGDTDSPEYYTRPRGVPRG